MNGWIYDAFNVLVERRILGEIRAALLSPLRDDIVEIGAGTGRYLPLLQAGCTRHRSRARSLDVGARPASCSRGRAQH